MIFGIFQYFIKFSIFGGFLRSSEDFLRIKRFLNFIKSFELFFKFQKF